MALMYTIFLGVYSGEALKDIATNIKPDRIIIETSGSAYPAPLAWEVNSHAPLVR